MVFSKWAKLEARGNAFLIDNDKLRLVERVALFTSKFVDRAGAVLAKLTRQQRWNYLSFALGQKLMDALRGRNAGEMPHAFLIDIFNPMPETAALTLAMSVSASAAQDAALPHPFLKRINLRPGENRELVPFRQFRDIIETGLPFNISLTPDNESRYRLVVRALDLVTLDAAQRALLDPPAASQAAPEPRATAAKCVVFDLDNTLWDGVLLENDDVALFDGVRELLHALDARGILLSLASKNTHEHAMTRLRELEIEQYFVFPRINWGPKSENIRQIAKDIDIGLDTFVFVDDNNFELEEVGQALPMVECIAADEIKALAAHPRLRGSTSEEARTRRQMYRESMVRSEAQSAFGHDYIAFLKSCEIELTIRPDAPQDFERVAELVQRTNQLNFSGHKYAREEVAHLLADDTIERYVLICEDKFGRYGTVGFCMARRDGACVRVQDFMLSCRVQGKFVEMALFDYLCNAPGVAPANIMEINFKRTQRNAPAQQVLSKLGFDVPEQGVARREVTPDTFAVDFIRVNEA